LGSGIEAGLSYPVIPDDWLIGIGINCHILDLWRTLKAD
jgi:hypothetical protein